MSDLPKPKRERRNLTSALREHYATDETKNQPITNAEPKPQTNSKVSGTQAKKSFDSKQYLDEVLRNKSLKELLEVDSALIKDIKQLDNNMKTLVYDNYKKFISAATTIKAMRSKVDNMEEEMKKLESTVEKISTSSDRISTTLESNRNQIEQLSGVHHLLQKLQFLIELPNHLRQSVSLGAYADAVNHYSRTQKVLEKYKHFPSFAPIEKQCTQIIKDLVTILETKFHSSNATRSQLGEYSGLLIGLGQEKEPIMKYLLQRYHDEMHNALNGYEDLTPFNIPNGDQKEVEKVVAKLLNSFMPPFFDMCKVYSATCIARATTTEEQWSAIHSLDQQVASAIARYCEIFTKYLVRANSPNGENTVATLDMPVLQMGSDAIEKLLSGYFDEVYQPTTFPENITHLKTDSDLRDRPYYVNSLLVSVLNVHFTDFLHKLRVYAAAETCNKPLESVMSNAMVDNLSTFISTTIVATIRNLRGVFLACSPNEFLHYALPSLIENVQDQVKAAFVQIVDLFINLSGKDESNIVMLISPLVIEAIRSKVLIQVENELWSLINSTENAGALNSQILHSRMNEISSALAAQSSRAISAFAQSRGTNLGKILRQAVETTNWLKKKEPNAIEPTIELLVAQIKELQPALSIYEDTNSQKKDIKRVVRHSDEDLFHKRVGYFDKVEANYKSINMNIIKVASKALIEALREQIMNTYGYQQFQVNCHFLRESLQELTTDSLVPILKEILSSAKDRCVDPTPMEQVIIDKIVQPKLGGTL